MGRALWQFFNCGVEKSGLFLLPMLGFDLGNVRKSMGISGGGLGLDGGVVGFLM